MAKKKSTENLIEKVERRMPVFAGTKLATARQVIWKKVSKGGMTGKPVWAIDADGELYEFRSCAEVERQTRINSGRISSAILDYKKGKREVPLVEGFVWLYCADKDYLPKLQAWIALNAADNRKTHI